MQGLIAAGKGHGAAVYIAALFGVMNMGPIYVRSGETSFGRFALMGAVAGVVALYLVAMLARNFSRWFGGRASLKAVRTALGISLIPLTLLSAILFLVSAMQIDASVVRQWMPLLLGWFLYSYVIVLLSMAAGLGLSVLKTFLCLLLAAVVTTGIMTLLLSLLGVQPPAMPVDPVDAL